MPKIPSAAYPTALSLSFLKYPQAHHSQSFVHQITFDTYTLNDSLEQSKKYTPWIKKENKFPNAYGEEASVFKVLFSRAVNLFIKDGLAPSSRIILNAAGEVEGVASEHIVTLLERALEESTAASAQAMYVSNDWKISPIVHVLKPQELAQTIREDMTNVLKNYSNVEFTPEDIEIISQSLENASENDRILSEPQRTLQEIFLRRHKLRALTKGVHFLNQFPAGFFAQLRQAETEGNITVDTASLVTALSASYIFEDDDPHKGNIGFYIIEEKNAQGKQTTKFVFFKADFDLMFMRPNMSALDLHIVDTVLAEHSNPITTRDLENFPDIHDAQLHYWPTETRYFAKGKKVYSKGDASSFRLLKKDPAFQHQKWKCFLKHAVMPIGLVEAHLRLDVNDATGFDKIVRMRDVVSMRLQQLRHCLIESKDFLSYYQELKQEKTLQNSTHNLQKRSNNLLKLKHDIQKEIADAIQPGVSQTAQEVLLQESANAFDNICLFLENKLAQKKHSRTNNQEEKKSHSLFIHDRANSLHADALHRQVEQNKYGSVDEIDIGNSHAIHDSPHNEIDLEQRAEELDYQEEDLMSISPSAHNLSHGTIELPDDTNSENVEDNGVVEVSNFPSLILNRASDCFDTILLNNIKDKETIDASNYHAAALPSTLHNTAGKKKLSRISRSIFLDFYEFHAPGKLRANPSSQDIQLAYKIFCSYLNKPDEQKAFKYACILQDLMKHVNAQEYTDLLKKIDHFKREYFGFSLDALPTLTGKKQRSPLSHRIPLHLEKFKNCLQKIQESDLPLKQKKAQAYELFQSAHFSLSDLEKLKCELGQLEPDSLILKFINQFDPHPWCLKKRCGTYGFTDTNQKFLHLIDKRIQAHLAINDQLLQDVNFLKNGTYFYSLQFFEDLKNDPASLHQWLQNIYHESRARVLETEEHVEHLKKSTQSHKMAILNNSLLSHTSLIKRRYSLDQTTQSQRSVADLEKRIFSYEKQLSEYKFLAAKINPEKDPANLYKTIDAFQKNPNLAIEPHCPAENVLFSKSSKCHYDKQTGAYIISPEDQAKQDAALVEAQIARNESLQKPTEIIDEATLAPEDRFSIPPTAYQVNPSATSEADYLKFSVYFKDASHSLSYPATQHQPIPLPTPASPPMASFVECLRKEKVPYRIIVDHFPQEADFQNFPNKHEQKKALEFARIVYCHMMLVQFFQKGKKPIIWSRDPIQFNYTIAVLKKLAPEYKLDKRNLSDYISPNSPCQLPPKRKGFFSRFFSKNPLSSYENLLRHYADKLRAFQPHQHIPITSLRPESFIASSHASMPLLLSKF